jgi:GT2 family glycosyltransferase
MDDVRSRELIQQIVLIDQNPVPLDLNLNSFEFDRIRLSSEECSSFRSNSKSIIQIHGLSPSVTRAKNLGCSIATAGILVFFDDDVTVLPGAISAYAECFLDHPEVAFLGGREILESPVLAERTWKSKLRRWLQGSERVDTEYRFQGKYIGRIKPNSIMLKDFSLMADRLIRIDGARGCNWACRKEWFDRAGGFDEHFEGSALREETDLYVRMNGLGAKGYYLAKAAVIHHRQLGGCDNLRQSINSLRSKLANDFYFQQKHFKSVPRFYFMARTFPLVLETLRETRGQSLWVWLAYWFKSR